MASMDVEKLIHSLEFENQQYVKEIEKERTQIDALKKQMEEMVAGISDTQEAISKLDMDTKVYHKQFTQNRDNIESLKKTTYLLMEQEQALRAKKNTLELKGKDERKEYNGLETHYSTILEDYKKKYESFPFSIALKQAEVSLKQSQERLNEAHEKRNQVQEMIESQQRTKGDEFNPCRTVIELGIKLAEIKVSSRKVNDEIYTLRKENGKLDRKLNDAINEIELKQKKDAEEKARQEAALRQKKRQEEEELERRKQILIEKQKQEEERRIQEERKKQEEAEQRVLEERMKRASLASGQRMDPPTLIPPPRKSPLKPKSPASTLVSPKLGPNARARPDQVPQRRSPPKMIIPKSPSLRQNMGPGQPPQSPRIPSLQMPTFRTQGNCSEIRTQSPATNGETPKLPFAKMIYEGVTKTSQQTQPQNSLASPGPKESVSGTPVPSIAPRTADSPKQMEVQEKDLYEEEENIYEEMVVSSPEKAVPKCKTPTSEVEYFDDPRTPGGSVDMDMVLENLKQMQAISPGFAYAKRPMFEETESSGGLDTGDSAQTTSTNAPPPSSSIFGGGDFSTFDFASSSSARNMFASPPGQGAPKGKTDSPNANMFGNGAGFNFGSSSSPSVFNMFGDGDSGDATEDTGNAFSLDFGSSPMATSTDNTKFSFF